MIGHSLAGAVSATDISAIGPLARSAGDARLALEILAGPDPAESGARFELPPPRRESFAGLRVAVWADDPASPTDPEITAQLHALAGFLAGSGAEVRFARPSIDVPAAYELFLKLIAAAISQRLAPEVLEAARVRAAAAPDDPSPDAVMDRHYGLLHREWLALNEQRHRIRRRWQAFFDDADVLLCPAFATPALPHDTTTEQRDRRVTVNAKTVSYNSLGFWAGIVGAYYLPATVAPLGLTVTGLPIGVQVVGPLHGDLQTLAVAELLERDWRAFVPPPAFASSTS
jgi:amidase